MSEERTATSTNRDGAPSGLDDLHGPITNFTDFTLVPCLRRDGTPIVLRDAPRSADDARARLRQHESSCPLNGGAMCPARVAGDMYGYRRKCLIHAVLADDWQQLLVTEGPPLDVLPEVAKYNEGLPAPVERYSTTLDGRWSDSHYSGEGVRSANVEEFVAAGGREPTPLAV